MKTQQELHKVVEERVKKNCERQRLAASRGQLPSFAVGDMLWWQGYGGRARRRSW